MFQGKLSIDNFYKWYRANYCHLYSPDILYKVKLNGTLIGYGFFDSLDINLAEDSDINLERVVFISKGCIPTGYKPKHKDHLIDGYELCRIDNTDTMILQSALNFLISEIREFNKSNTTNWNYHFDTLGMYITAIQSLNIYDVIKKVKEGVIYHV